MMQVTGQAPILVTLDTTPHVRNFPQEEQRERGFQRPRVATRGSGLQYPSRESEVVTSLYRMRSSPPGPGISRLQFCCNSTGGVARCTWGILPGFPRPLRDGLRCTCLQVASKPSVVERHLGKLRLRCSWLSSGDNIAFDMLLPGNPHSIHLFHRSAPPKKQRFIGNKGDFTFPGMCLGPASSLLT